MVSDPPGTDELLSDVSPGGRLVPNPTAVVLAAPDGVAVCWESTPGVPATADPPVVGPAVAGIPDEGNRVPDCPALVPVAPDDGTVG